MIVIMPSGLVIVVLAGKPEIIDHQGTGIHVRLTEGPIIRLPDHGVGLIGHDKRCAQMIVGVKIHAASAYIYHGKAGLINIKVLVVEGAAGLAFTDDVAVKVVMKHRDGAVHGLCHPLPQAVVGIFAQDRGILFHPHQAVVLVVCQYAVVDAGDVAVGIVGVADRAARPGDLIDPVGSRCVGIGFGDAVDGPGLTVADPVVGKPVSAVNAGGIGQTVQRIVGEGLIG